MDGERIIVLDPAETRTETFTFSAPDEPGNYEITVDGLARPLTVERVVVPALLNLVRPLSVSPIEVRPDEAVTISVILRNTGEESGPTDVILRVRGEVVETKRVLVPGGLDVPVEFTVTRTEAGNYEVGVEAVEAAEITLLRGTFTVVALPPPPEVPEVVVPRIIIGPLTIEPRTVKSGEPIVVSVVVTNEADFARPQSLAVIVDGEFVEERDITVDARTTQTVTFTVVERGSGTHTLTVAGATAEFTVTKPAPLAVTILLLVLFAFLVGGLSALGYIRATRGVPHRRLFRLDAVK